MNEAALFCNTKDKEYMRHFKDISTATASRDLKQATEMGILVKLGEKNTTLYKFNQTKI